MDISPSTTLRLLSSQTSSLVDRIDSGWQLHARSICRCVHTHRASSKPDGIANSSSQHWIIHPFWAGCRTHGRSQADCCQRIVHAHRSDCRTHSIQATDMLCGGIHADGATRGDCCHTETYLRCRIVHADMSGRHPNISACRVIHPYGWSWNVHADRPGRRTKSHKATDLRLCNIHNDGSVGHSRLFRCGSQCDHWRYNSGGSGLHSRRDGRTNTSWRRHGWTSCRVMRGKS